MMDNPWLPRYASVVAVSTLILLISGAVFAPDTTAYRLALGVALLLSAVLVAVARNTGAARGISLLFVLLIADGLLGMAFSSQPMLAGLIHSCVLCAIFSLAVTSAVQLTAGWATRPLLLEDAGNPPLRSIASFSICALSVQVLLGASFRREVLPVIPHIIGAMLAAAIILYLVMAVFMQYSSHRELMYPAVALTGLIAAQVLLGIGAYLSKVGSPVAGFPPQLFSAAHIVTGSLTMAATVLLTLRIHRHLPALGGTAERSLAVNS